MNQRKGNHFLEITAPAINNIWASRKPLEHALVSERVYDEDYNLITSDSPSVGTTEIYRLSEPSMDAVPCSRLERLMMVLSFTPHQSLLILHLHLQGNLKFIKMEKIEKISML